MIMKHLYRLILITVSALTFFVSCMEEEAAFAPETFRRGNIQITAAVIDFDNKVVGTKALGSEENDESLITEMTMFIFDNAGKAITAPVTIRDYNTKPDAFMIEIGTGQTGIIGTLNGQTLEYDKTNPNLDKCSIYIVANAEHYKKTDALGNEVSVYSGISTLDELLAQTLPLEGFEMPRIAGKKAGFPMIGTAKDGTTFNLRNASQNQNTVATIPLRKLYSKVTVNILVHADQVVSKPEFELLKWSVKNSPKQVAFGSSTTVTSYEDSGETKYATNQVIIHTDAIANPDPSSVMSFTFYMPEHLVSAEKESSYSYPTGTLPDEKQKFKPALLGDGQKATYVLIEGIYTDHHGLVKQVAYRLYLGQNNYNDFKVIRNQHLINQVTIKGITNSTNAIVPGQPDNISVDHRVDITNEGISIAMERETLIDAHFEFRPVDITLSPHSSLTVTIPESDRTWVAIEKSQPSGASHVSGVGIRKYFTTDLISTLTTDNDSDVAGPVLKYENNTDSAQKYRFWLYVDENPNVYDKTGHGKFTGEGGSYTVDQTPSRKSKIVFEFTDSQGTQTLNYNLVQRNLWRIWNGDWNDQTETPEPTRYYDIEYFEEYLYNYAADDPISAITDGMEWGLNGVTFSGNMGDGLKTKALVASSSGGWAQETVNNIINSLAPYYDFYLTREARDISEALVNADNDFAGRRFSNGIIDSDPDGAGSYVAIGQIKRALNDTPSSAIEYCLHKNRRNPSNSLVTERSWYLPAIDEMEQIMVGGYSDFSVFQDKKYWSCQPAFHKNFFLYNTNWFASWIGGSESDTWGDYYLENTQAARATSARFIGKDVNGNDVYTYLGSGIDESIENIADSYDQYLNASYNNQNAAVQAVPDAGVTLEYWDGTRGSFNIPVTSSKTIYKVQYASGYNGRQNDINRVRCVYRSGKVN